MRPDLRAFWQLVRLESVDTLIRNAACEPSEASADGVFLPTALHTAPTGQANICSLRTHYLDYAREEIGRLRSLSAFTRAISRSGLGMLDVLASASRLDDVVTVNNLLLTTCLYPSLAPGSAAQLTLKLAAQNPGRAIIWRSLVSELTPALVSELTSAGCALLPWRNIYLNDPASTQFHAQHSRDAARDLRLAQSPPNGYTWSAAPAFTDSDWERSAELFRGLYVEKYSTLNPQYTAAFFKLCHASECFQVIGLRAPNGVLDGVILLYQLAGVQAAPLLGYDLTKPREFALYRLLCAKHWLEAMKAGLWLHQSAGVATFKKNRGALPAIESLGVYYAHLPRTRRLAWQAFIAAIRHVAVPITQRYET